MNFDAVWSIFTLFRNEFNPFKPNGISYDYQLGESISVLGGVG